jgi:hypothetical protein
MDKGPFIAGRRLDNYKLFISISTKGFTWLVDPDMRRSVGGAHGVWAYSGFFQAPSYYSPGPPRQWGGWCLSRFLGRLLSEVFLWQWCLPSLSDEVDRLASPCTGLRHIAAYWGTGLACEVLSGLLTVVVGDVCRGKGSFQGCCYWLEVLSSWYLAMEYRIVKWVLTRRCLPPGKVMILIRRVP